jgi:hypothetical protein
MPNEKKLLAFGQVQKQYSWQNDMRNEALGLTSQFEGQVMQLIVP